MSTGTMPPDTQALTTTTKRSKKLFPSCDACKARRVLCHSQPPGIPCPRCFEKGVECTTTPVIRRKRRTKAEVLQEKMEAEAASLSTSVASTPLTDGDSEERESLSNASQPNMESIVPELWGLIQRNSLILPALAPPSLDLPISLVSELFRSFRDLPQYYQPVIPYHRLETTLQRSVWQLSTLPPQDRVLVQCILAVSSLSSMNTDIIGTDSCSTEHVDLVSSRPLIVRNADLREYGWRRELTCQQLRGEAVRLASQEGVAVNVSQENAASCMLLDFLEYRATGQGVTPYTAAYTAHLRSIQESSDTFSKSAFDVGKITWASAMMGHCIIALVCGNSMPFTKHDELLLCGESSCSLQDVLQVFLSDDSTYRQFFAQMHPLGLYTINLARESSEHLTGAYARRQSFNEATFIFHLGSLDTLHTVVMAMKNRADALRSKDKDNPLTSYLQICTFIVVHSWANITLTLYGELERRCSTHSLSEPEAGQRTRERLELCFQQVRKVVLKAAVEVAGCLEEVPSIHRLTHINYTEINRWARLLLATMDDMVITPVERAQALERFRDALKLTGFSWVDRTGLVEAIELKLPNIALASEDSEEDLFSISTLRGGRTMAEAQSVTSMSWLWTPNNNALNEFAVDTGAVFGYTGPSPNVSASHTL